MKLLQECNIKIVREYYVIFCIILNIMNNVKYSKNC